MTSGVYAMSIDAKLPWKAVPPPIPLVQFWCHTLEQLKKVPLDREREELDKCGHEIGRAAARNKWSVDEAISLVFEAIEVWSKDPERGMIPAPEIMAILENGVIDGVICEQNDELRYKRDNNVAAIAEMEIVPFREVRWRPEKKSLVKQIIPSRGIGLLVGPSSTGKSALALDLGLSIARGTTWCGKATMNGVVVYVAAEAPDSAERRIEAYREKHGLHEEDLHFYLLKSAPHLNKPDSSGPIVQLLNTLERSFGPIRALIIDTLAAATVGMDENESSQMGALINSVQEIASEIETTVILVHHTGKDVERGARGHSSLGAAVDFQINVSRAKEIVTLRLAKLRDDIPDSAFDFALEPIEIGLDEDGEPVTGITVRFDGVQNFSAAAAAPKGQAGLMWNLLRDLIQSKGIDISQHCSVPPGTRGCRIEELRQGCETVQLTSSLRQASRKAAFDRAFQNLLDADLIGREGEFVWCKAAV